MILILIQFSMQNDRFFFFFNQRTKYSRILLKTKQLKLKRKRKQVFNHMI